MAILFSNTLADARLNVIESHIGASPTLAIYSTVIVPFGITYPATDLVWTCGLGADWLTASNNGIATGGPWTNTCSNTATLTYFRILASNGEAQIQGTIGTSITDDIYVSNADVIQGQSLTISSLNFVSGEV